jgi:DNA-binding NarL/FixJ family response regulator
MELEIVNDVVESNQNRFVYYCSGSFQLTTAFSKILRDKFNTKSVIIDQTADLIKFVNNEPNNIGFLVVDIEYMSELKGVNVYDYVHMLSTILSMRGNNTAIVAAVSTRTTSEQLKTFAKIPELKGMILYPSECFDSEFEEAIADFNNNKSHIPRRIKEIIQDKKKKFCSNAIELTPRQQQILDLVVARGASNKVIANILKIAESTVKLHITAILKKYGLRNRTQLALFVKNNN